MGMKSVPGKESEEKAINRQGDEKDKTKPL
jgi:hypothetical protein